MKKAPGIRSLPCPAWTNGALTGLREECRRIEGLGIPAVILFGIPETKDPEGTGAYAEDGLIPQTVEAIHKACSSLVVMTDVCLCEYTSHGHCGVLDGETILNDETVELLAREAGGARPVRQRRDRAVGYDGWARRGDPGGA